MVADSPAIWMPLAPAIIRPATADLLLTPAYWPADPRQRVLAFRDLRDAGRFSSDQIREAAAIWKVKGAIVLFAPVFFMTGEAPRSFSISPAVSGKTTWDLDVDGPLTLTSAGTWTITPDAGFAATVQLNGGGGGGGGISGTGTGGSAGSSSTFPGMTAGGGSGAARAAGSDATSTGGAGGTASGGDTNTSGSAGGNGSSSAGTGTSGSGGASPNGGATKAGTTSTTTATTTFPGTDGNAPGGGGSGTLRRSSTNTVRQAAGGGGGAAYCSKAIAAGTLTPGVGVSVTVGAGGAGGDTGGTPAGTGADGRVIIT